MGELLMADRDSGVSIRKEGNKFNLAIKDRFVEQFSDYKDAARLATDLFVSMRSNNTDELIGQRKFVAAGLGNGGNVVVVAKTKDDTGYIVQRSGTKERFEIMSYYFQDPA